jgi:D-glycero-alpha-D-manno-heptose-7-phosphate kinase
MISTRTPLRVTLGGGGTDLASYYRHGGGFIFAMALDKYVHITAHRPPFQRGVSLHGYEPESASVASSVRHELVRAALMRHGIEDQFESSCIADIAGGTGLGSSSSFLVGLLSALHAIEGRSPSRQALAEEACTIEIDTLAKGIGKQDQYMAAFGGLTTLDIAPDGQVKVGAVAIADDVEAAFVAHTHIYYTGLRRDASVILEEQNAAMSSDAHARRAAVGRNLDYIKDLGYRIRDAWVAGDLEAWGHMLDEHWRQKKQMSSKISWPTVDQLYDHVKAEFGVTGGKVIGAGGGGFLMLFTPGPGEALEAYMDSQQMPRLRYAIDRGGAQVLVPRETA